MRPTAAATTCCNAPRLSGPNWRTARRCAGTAPSSMAGTSRLARAVASSPTGSSRSRRMTKAITVAVGASSQGRSSIAMITVPLAARARTAPSAARETASWSGAPPADSLRRSAASSADRCGAGSDDETSSTTSSNRSPSPTNDSGASDSTARVARMSATPERRRIAASHSAVLPMPSSPAISSAAKPRGSPETNASMCPSSRSRPTNGSTGIPLAVGSWWRGASSFHVAGRSNHRPADGPAHGTACVRRTARLISCRIRVAKAPGGPAAGGLSHA